MAFYWEDVVAGAELPRLSKEATTRQLVQYAGASLDFYEIHYDTDFALANGLPGVVIHGALKSAWLAQMVTEWMGPDGRIAALIVRYREVDVPGNLVQCRGRVMEKYRADGKALVECDVWLENSQGQRTTEGAITVELASRGT